MRTVTVKVHESKYDIFLALIKDLELEKDAENKSYTVSQAEQDLILDRVKNSTPATRKKWEDVKNTFKF